MSLPDVDALSDCDSDVNQQLCLARDAASSDDPRPLKRQRPSHFSEALVAVDTLSDCEPCEPASSSAAPRARKSGARVWTYNDIFPALSKVIHFKKCRCWKNSKQPMTDRTNCFAQFRADPDAVVREQVRLRNLAKSDSDREVARFASHSSAAL